MDVTIAGRVDPALRAGVSDHVRRIRDNQPALNLVLHDRWIAAPELEAMVGASDVVLAPYQRFVGSSGVLLWAARAGLPILTQDFGLLGRLVRDHGLGLVADTMRPESLAAVIARMVTGGPRRFIDLQSARSFAARRTPHDFASAVVQSLQSGDRQ
jgi:glycosyltransferase involved in cell wall biosynthesis